MDTSKSISKDHVKTPALIDLKSPLFQRFRDALRLLFFARGLADQHGGKIWDFAEEITSLWHRGMTNGDLRWLVCSGFLEHGHEVTEIGDDSRKFQRDEGLHFPKRTCFILTEKGASYVKEHLNEAEPKLDSLPAIKHAEGFDPLIPNWNRDLQELRWNNKLVKRFNVPAPNQEMILAVFQEENWPVCIDDPLRRHPEIDPKRRLRDTINSLNRNQKQELIHFGGNGSGDGVRWELRNQSSTR